MEGKDAIISKIIEDAQRTARGVIEDAEQKARVVVDEAKTYAEDYRKKALSVVEKEKNEIIRRRETVARLDVNKMILGAKQRVLDKVFERALEILENLPEDRYQELIEGMLSKYASDGDVVTVRKDRKATLTKVFFQAYGKLNGIKLGYDVKGGDFRGGMILSSDGVDKNLTFEVELQSLRDEIEPEIAAKLFSVVE